MSDNMRDNAEHSERHAASYERTSELEQKYDRKLAEKTKAVATALRSRAAYIRSRLDA